MSQKKLNQLYKIYGKNNMENKLFKKLFSEFPLIIILKIKINHSMNVFKRI